MLIIILFILILILIFILYDINYNNELSSNNFWDKQPVMRKYVSNFNIIGQIPKFEINLMNDMKIESNDNIDINNIGEIIKFLDDNFSGFLKIVSKNTIDYILDKKTTSIKLYKNNKLVGFIHSRPLIINYDGNEYKLNYVEYLCVLKELRGCNIASILIASIIERMNEIEYDQNRLYLFKKDGDKHRFLPIIESRYMCLDIEKIKKDLDINEHNIKVRNIDDIRYDEWNKKNIGHKLYIKMDEEEWKGYIINRKIYRIEIEDKKYNIIGSVGKIKDDNKVFDIEYIYKTEDDRDVNKWNDLIIYLWDEGYKYITMNDISDHMNILGNIGGWELGNNFQYYLYNGECRNIDNVEVNMTIN